MKRDGFGDRRKLQLYGRTWIDMEATAALSGGLLTSSYLTGLRVPGSAKAQFFLNQELLLPQR